MPGIKLTYLICFDDHRTFTEDVKKRFSDISRYEVVSFNTSQDFLTSFHKERDISSCKVGIIGVPDNREQFETIGNLSQEVKRIDPDSGIILLVSADKLEDLKKAIRYNIDAYVPRNANAILRIHNTVKKLISEHSITVFRKKRNISLYVLLAFLIISAIIILISYLKLPQYF
jgi:DNA-binding NarL/FixJ family response regulator